MNPRWALSVCALLSAGGVLSVGAGAPELERLSADAHRSTRVFDRSGHPLAESLSPRDTRNRPVALENVSPSVVAALLATEDRRFYEHGGIDLRATLRAALANLHALRVEQGGSTLTQQLARLLRVDAAVERGESPPGRTVSQKLLEAHLALRLEQAHSKPAILQAFLNRAPFGNSAVGIDAAAWRYFNVSADALSPAQAAMLVALIRGPSFYDPFAHPDRLRERTHRVLDGMHQTGHLTDLQWQRARAEPLNPQRHSTERSSVHALALARREWRGRGGGRWPDQLHLTVDRTLESRIRRVVQDEAPKIYSRGARSSAVVVIDVPSGEVLAAVGATFEDNPHWGEYSAVTAERQPGSALKPFLYGLALEKGLSAAELAADIERPFADTWGIYKPRNYDELYHGPVRFRAALAQSLNVAAVDVLDRVGQPEFYSTLEAFGLTTLERRSAHYGLGIVLGSSPVHLIDLTNAYAALARRGEWRTWTVLKPSEARLQDRDP
ncbi:MAG: transglycosylase domain-containing protein, partial [Myxococcota bacterium]